MRRFPVVALLAVLGLADAPPVVAASLPPGRVGTPLSAPAGDPAAVTLRHQWQRCWRYSTLVGADAPMGWWPLQDGSGAARAGGPDARLVGAPGTAPGALAGESSTAMRLDGSADAAIASSAATLDGTRPYTIELWVRPALIDGRYRYALAQEGLDGGRYQGTGLWVSRTGVEFERLSDGGKAAVSYGRGLDAGRWTHVAASYDGRVMRLFVGGRQVGSRVSTAPLRTAGIPLVIGARDSARSGWFAGDLDEAAIYPRAVPRAHIAAHAAAGEHAACATIAGATAATYRPAGGDVGFRLRARTTSLDAGGHELSSVLAETAGPVSDVTGARVTVRLDEPDTATASGTVAVTATPGGLPADRVEFLVDGHVRYAKPAEAPYRYTWYTRAEHNGGHTVAVRLIGPGGVAQAERTVSVRNPTEYPPPLPFGKESMYAEFNEGDEATARNLLDDVWPARGFPLVNLGRPLTWTEDPYGDAYWRFYFYALRPESSLLYMWRTTGDRRYLDKLIAILRSYAAHDAVRSANTLTFDNNHAAAYRTMTLLNFYAKLAQDGSCPPTSPAGCARRSPASVRSSPTRGTSRAASTTGSTRPLRCCCWRTTCRRSATRPRGGGRPLRASRGC